MQLYLMRHGFAAPAAPGQRDRDRTLTPEGLRMLSRQAEVLKRAGVRVDRLFTSPLVRARQTAEVLGSVLYVDVEQEHLLKPGCSLDDVAALLARHPNAERVLLVGHQPYLGHLVRTLTGSQATMRPGMLAFIETPRIQPASGVLFGLYDPEVMARLAPA